LTHISNQQQTHFTGSGQIHLSTMLITRGRRAMRISRMSIASVCVAILAFGSNACTSSSPGMTPATDNNPTGSPVTSKVPDAGSDEPNAIFCVDAGPPPTCNSGEIRAADYDQSCRTNDDCIIVGEGQSCEPCSLAYGPFSAIGRTALPMLQADIAKTPGGRASGGVSCLPSCSPALVACCVTGKCEADTSCSD
jgi:hypothetical protein